MKTPVEDCPRCSEPASCGGQSGATCEPVLPCQSWSNMDDGASAGSEPPGWDMDLDGDTCCVPVESMSVCGVLPVSSSSSLFSSSSTYFWRRRSHGASETVYLQASSRRAHARHTTRFDMPSVFSQVGRPRTACAYVGRPCWRWEIQGHVLPGRHPSQRTFLARQFSHAIAILRFSDGRGIAWRDMVSLDNTYNPTADVT